jgi:oligopeptide/dipeptide ABC transporter ATP-binding protein
LLRLIEPSAGRLTFDGTDLSTLSGSDLFAFRRRAQMVFQDPYGSLNPRLTVEETLSEVFFVHRLCPRGEIRGRVRELMQRVGLSADLSARRPHSLSGGQCQRVGIARALAVGPELIIADEPVSALDVSIQAQILNLFETLQHDMQLSLLFISHDLGVVRHLCRMVAVMYLGRIVEFGPTEAVFESPRHPYTQALLAAMPRLDVEGSLPRRGLAGEPPSPASVPPGCPFHPRCPEAMPVCRNEPAPEERAEDGVQVRCHLYPLPMHA